MYQIMWGFTIIYIVTRKKKKKNEKKILCKCQSKLSVAHSRHTEPHYSDLDTHVRTKLDSITWSSFKIVCNTKTYIQKCLYVCHKIFLQSNLQHNIARYDSILLYSCSQWKALIYRSLIKTNIFLSIQPRSYNMSFWASPTYRSFVLYNTYI